MDIKSHVSPADNDRVCQIVAEAVRKGVLVKPARCSWCGDDAEPPAATPRMDCERERLPEFL